MQRQIVQKSLRTIQSRRALFHSEKQLFKKALSSSEVIDMENKYSAHNYHPLPVVYERAEGVEVWDPEGKKYIDFLSAYSAVNQGHRHPKIMKAMADQMQNVTLSSRAFYNSVFGQWAKFITEFFGYERVLPMNTGAEAVETAIKLARKWGYSKKGIPENEAIFIACSENFHGRTLAVVSMSTDPDSFGGYGPYLPGIKIVEYNNVNSLKEVLEKHGEKVCGFLVEPIQGEAGVVVPHDGYLKQCYELCKKHNVLFIADEIQTGVGRTGKLLAHEWDGFKADVVLLAKAISGGVYPVSAVLASSEIMDVFTPGTHGSTYGGNPLGCAVSIAALEVIRDEKLCENSESMGQLFRKEMRELMKPSPFCNGCSCNQQVQNCTCATCKGRGELCNCKSSIVTQVRGKGLLNAIVVNHEHDKMKSRKMSGYEICKILKTRGVLAKQTHGNIIRFTPPLVITEKQMMEATKIIKDTILEIENH